MIMFNAYMLICLLCFLLIFVILLVRFTRNSRFNELWAKIPGPPVKYPLIGNLDMFWKYRKTHSTLDSMNMLALNLTKTYQDHGINKFQLFNAAAVCIYRSDFVEDLLKCNTNLAKPYEYRFMLFDWLGNGLLINDNIHLWRQRRKLLTPAFHLKVIEDYLPVINEKADILVDNLAKIGSGQEIDLVPLLVSCALDMIAESAMGAKLNTQQNQNQEYVHAIDRLNQHFFNRLFKPWLWPSFIFYMTSDGKQFRKDVQTFHNLTEKLINERKAYYSENRESQQNSEKRLSFLDLLLDIHLKNNSMSLKDIREEVDTFLFAGHDTTASCLSWTFHLIGLHQDIQKKIQNELDSIIRPNQDITSNQIKRMTYLDAVIKESLRIYPPVPVFGRKIDQDIKLGPYLIPKGVTVTVSLPSLHMNPNPFPDPSKFDPDRFLIGQQSGKSSPFVYCPFSGGTRNCIGQKFALNELKVVLAKVLINFNIKSIDKRYDTVFCKGFVNKPDNGVNVIISPRLL